MARRARSVRLTARGFAFLAAAFVVGAAAVATGQREVLRIAALLLALPLLSLLISRRTRVRLGAARALEPSRVAVSDTSVVHLRLTADGRPPDAVLLLEDSVPGSLGGQPRFVVEQGGANWRRQVTYRLNAEIRGRYTIGPLSTRIVDPFGLVTTTRTFSGTSILTVTPKVVELANIALAGDLTGSGETRPRSITAAGEEDTTIRPYAHGDDMRRVHWRATARHGELMVRREEQPWQSRCTVVLDTRERAHAGDAPASSFEYAVSAAASIAVHMLNRGYSVRLISDDGAAVTGSWLDPGSGPASGEGALLDALAVIETSRRASIGTLQTLMSGGGTSSGLLIGVFGRLSPRELSVLGRLAHDTHGALGLVLDVDSWAPGQSAAASTSRRSARAPAAEADSDPKAAASALSAAGWRAVVADQSDPLHVAWQRLSPGGRPADWRAMCQGGAR